MCWRVLCLLYWKEQELRPNSTCILTLPTSLQCCWGVALHQPVFQAGECYLAIGTAQPLPPPGRCMSRMPVSHSSGCKHPAEEMTAGKRRY